MNKRNKLQQISSTVSLTSTLHPLCSCVDSMRQGTDNTELGEKGDTTGAFKLRGRASQMRADPRQRDLRGVRLQNHQVALQLFEGQAALLVETSGMEEGNVCVKVRKRWKENRLDNLALLVPK